MTQPERYLLLPIERLEQIKKELDRIRDLTVREEIHKAASTITMLLLGTVFSTEGAENSQLTEKAQIAKR